LVEAKESNEQLVKYAAKSALYAAEFKALLTKKRVHEDVVKDAVISNFITSRSPESPQPEAAQEVQESYLNKINPLSLLRKSVEGSKKKSSAKLNPGKQLQNNNNTNFHQGVLYKRRDCFKNEWRRRWFVLPTRQDDGEEELSKKNEEYLTYFLVDGVFTGEDISTEGPNMPFQEWGEPKRQLLLHCKNRRRIV